MTRGDVHWLPPRRVIARDPLRWSLAEDLGYDAGGNLDEESSSFVGLHIPITLIETSAVHIAVEVGVQHPILAAGNPLPAFQRISLSISEALLIGLILSNLPVISLCSRNASDAPATAQPSRSEKPPKTRRPPSMHC